MTKKIVIFGIVSIMVFLLFSYSIYQPPKQRLIEDDPSDFILKEKNILIKIENKYSVTSSQFSQIIKKPIGNLKDWGYETGFGARYEGENRGFYLVIARFSTINGTNSVFDSISEIHDHKMGRKPITKIGRESQAFLVKENINTVIFRESNIIVFVKGEILINEIEIYSELIEDKIRSSLRHQK